MAMTRCKECDHQVSTKAETCPNCGAELKRKGIGCGGLIAFVFLLVVILAVFGSISDSLSGKPKAAPVSKNAISEPTITDKQAQKVSEEAQLLLDQVTGKTWMYQSSKDEMSGTMSYFATLFSANQVNFGFPYNGKQRGKIMLRTHPRWGKDVIFQIEKGQLLCDYDGCNVLVKFGERPAVNYRATEPDDRSTELLFISDYRSFVSNMMKVDTVRISPKVYQEGSPVFTFDVKGFNADTYLGKTQ